MTKSIVFFGNEQLSSAPDYNQAPILASLIGQGWSIEALIVKMRPGRSRQVRRWAVLDLAQKHSLKTFKVANAEGLSRILPSLKSEMAVLASFGLILDQRTLNHFRLGIINAHPSLLPKGRGPTPIENSLLQGETETGVSLIGLSQRMDAGAIYAQSTIRIMPHETKVSLTQRLGRLAAEMIKQNLDTIHQQNLPPTAQDETRASYTQPIKAGNILEFHQAEAAFWERYIRAFDGCPNNRFALAGQIVAIKSARTADRDEMDADWHYSKTDRLLRIKCKQGVLAISQLQPANRGLMDARDFANGFLV